MEITEKRITIREIYEGYCNEEEAGVTGYNGRLNIRPPYQREFIYNDAQQKEVIHTIMRGLPLNVIYWAKIYREDGSEGYEVLDGQQRTLSICEFIQEKFSFEDQYYNNLPLDTRQKILEYPLFVYICDGKPSEKLDWFKIINIAGEELTDQELRNAVYAGPWVTSAKKKFSKTNGPAYKVGKDYLSGTAIRQDYLQTVLQWVPKGNLSLEEYMGKHQFDENAEPLWDYFRKVIDWVQATFPHYRSDMKGLNWGVFYNEHHEETLDPNYFEKEIKRLMDDYDVTKKKGIYEYLLTGEEKCLSIRLFDKRDVKKKYAEQKHKCAYCGKECELKDMHADHIKPWSKGGTSTIDNLQMLCIKCNLEKSNHE